MKILLPSSRIFSGFVLLIAGLAFCVLHTLSAAPVPMLTQHNDLNRTGANLNETALTTSTVTTNGFGLLFTRAVDNEIHTQPLIMTNVNISGVGVRNLVIVGTVSNTVYAFDAEDSSVANPYWQVRFVGPEVYAAAKGAGAVPALGWWGLQALSMAVFWGLLVWVALSLTRGADGPTRDPSPPAPPGTAEDLLADRFARGEIDEDEYTRRREVLRRDHQDIAAPAPR